MAEINDPSLFLEDESKTEAVVAKKEQNLTNLLQLKRRTPNMLLRSSTKSQESQSTKTPAKKYLPSSINSSPRSTTSADSKSSSPDKKRRPRSTTKRITSLKNNSSLVLMKIN
jgi:hypothetical protein